ATLAHAFEDLIAADLLQFLWRAHERFSVACPALKVTVMVFPDDARAIDSESDDGPSPVATNVRLRVTASASCPPTSVSGRAPMTTWQLGEASVTIWLALATRRDSVGRTALVSASPPSGDFPVGARVSYPARAE